jgi:DNA-binding PadR family transcriptional regulator
MQTARTDETWKSWTKGSSPLKGPLLALLNDGPGYPYDYAGKLSQRLGPSWATDLSSIYRILERFEQIGLASSHRAVSSRNKRQRVTMYEATDLTAVAVAQWMKSPLPDVPLRGPLAVRLAVSGPADALYLLRALDQYQQQCFDLLSVHRQKYPTRSWRGVDREAARQGTNLRINAELNWIHLVRGYIESFQAEGHTDVLNRVDFPVDESWKAWEKGSSSFKGPLLALLNAQSGHPNELAGRLCDRLGPTWQTRLSTICPILERLERFGLATSRDADSEKTGQMVRIYSATDLTPMAVAQWMESPLSELPSRGPLGVRIAVSRPADAPYLLQALDKHHQTCFDLLARHKDKLSVVTWADMEKELTRHGVNLQIGAELEWTNLVRGYIASFQDARDVSVVV